MTLETDDHVGIISIFSEFLLLIITGQYWTCFKNATIILYRCFQPKILRQDWNTWLRGKLKTFVCLNFIFHVHFWEESSMVFINIDNILSLRDFLLPKNLWWWTTLYKQVSIQCVFKIFSRFDTNIYQWQGLSNAYYQN